MAMKRPGGNRKLTPEQAREIFALMQDEGARAVEVAARYGVEVSQVRRISRGTAWNWLSDEAGEDVA
jgi:transposase-like protein